MSEKIPLSIPFINGNEWKYVKDCLDTGWISSVGKYVNTFEDKLKEFVKSNHAIACVNGTAALQISLIISGVKYGDEVIVPTLTFIAPVNAVKYLNAYPIFMDCDDYYNINSDKTIDFIRKETKFVDGFTINKLTGRKIKAIIPVHVFGNAVNFEDLYDLCRERNIKIVEDSTEALGTKYNIGKFKNKLAGTVGDLGCFSFNGNKIISTGGGGMIVTDNSEYAEKAKYLTQQAKDDSLKYIHHEVGYNFRLTNIQAAVGVAQLEQLSFFLEIKKKNYNLYSEKINKINGLKINKLPGYADNNSWMYALQIEEKVYGKNSEELMKFLSDENIEVRPVWYLNHLQKPYKNCQSYKIEKAVDLLKITLNLPCSVSLTNDQIEYICKKLVN